MKTSLRVPAVAALAVALSGCGGQALVGERASDPAPQPVSPEEARELAPEVLAEIEQGGAESGH